MFLSIEFMCQLLVVFSEGRLHLFWPVCQDKTANAISLSEWCHVSVENNCALAQASTNAVLFCHPVLACGTYSSGEKNGEIIVTCCDWPKTTNKQNRLSPERMKKVKKISLIYLLPCETAKTLTSSKITSHGHRVVPQAAGFLFRCLSGYNIKWQQPQQRRQRQLCKPFCNKYFTETSTYSWREGRPYLLYYLSVTCRCRKLIHSG